MTDSQTAQEIFTQTPDKTRLMIGLNWDMRKPEATEMIGAHTITGSVSVVTFIFWLIRTIVAAIVYVPTLGKVNWFIELPRDTPSAMIHETMSVKNKVADGVSSREGSYKQYDLDLHCFVLDSEDNIAARIGPEEENMVGSSAAIYHSGEEFTGQGVYDDETIHIDLRKLEAELSKFYIVVTSDNRFDFSQLDNKPKIRIVDSKLEKELSVVEIPTELPEAKGKHGFICGCLTKSGTSWSFKPIQQFCDFEQDWVAYFRASSH